MDETTFRILDALAKEIGRPISINGLKDSISRSRKPAYYKNVYDKVQSLRKEGTLNVDSVGRDSIVSLNFEGPDTLRLLTEMELRKQAHLGKSAELQTLLQGMKAGLRQGFAYLSSISMISPNETLPLNRIEFLFILLEPHEQHEGWFLEKVADAEQLIWGEIVNIHRIMRSLQSVHTIKLDFLILRERELLSLLEERQHNPLKEMIPGQTAFFRPEDFWITLKQAFRKGIFLEKDEKIRPSRILERDLVYNLSRFGYRELGPKMKEGKEVCIETVITSILLSGNARRVNAIPAILAKAGRSDRKPIYPLLTFLAAKHGVSGKLLGLLNVLSKLAASKELEAAIKSMESSNVREEQADDRAIRKVMEVYHASG